MNEIEEYQNRFEKSMTALHEQRDEQILKIGKIFDAMIAEIHELRNEKISEYSALHQHIHTAFHEKVDRAKHRLQTTRDLKAVCFFSLDSHGSTLLNKECFTRRVWFHVKQEIRLANNFAIRFTLKNCLENWSSM